MTPLDAFACALVVSLSLLWLFSLLCASKWG